MLIQVFSFFFIRSDFRTSFIVLNGGAKFVNLQIASLRTQVVIAALFSASPSNYHGRTDDAFFARPAVASLKTKSSILNVMPFDLA